MSEVTFKVKDYIDASQLKRDLAFSPNNLTDAMMQQASMFSHYGVLAADASSQVDTIKMLLENTEAAVYQILRDEFALRAEKVTEVLLEKKVARHSRVIAMKKALTLAKRVESIGKTAVEAFRHRRDMLVQQGLLSREEMKGEVHIAARNARSDAIDAQKESVLERLQRARGVQDPA